MTTPEIDPTIWQKMTEWLWAVLLLPVGALWKKVDNSASKEEIKDIVKSIKDSMDSHAKDDKETRTEIRDTQKQIFQRLDQQDKLLTQIDTTLTLKLGDLRKK